MVDARPVRPGPRRTLSEQAILDAALALLAELGADRVTIRGIATRVGIAPNAVYTYFPDKAAVLDGLAEQLLGRVDDNLVDDDRFTDSSRPWRERVHSLALELRTELLAHQGAVHLLLRSSLDGPNANAVGATLLTILADAGLDPASAAKGSHLLNVHILGSVALETADAAAATDQFLWGLDRLLDGLITYVGAQRDDRTGPRPR
ncbi:MAG: TetR family transcriptional regulator [Actinophytocola sp.]|uniref:TetR/AcrR family transcriptional regulator n=1 Tax=Actinophytocola sp. TaxID=1872138 RepID=UPI00132BD2AD|nr:TetR/AcrR family transcriptional regulator [Actinophytocola sp.]MPZ82557.1 TetR family transcriptional regulator [Actinophytocola sp.]